MDRERLAAGTAFVATELRDQLSLMTAASQLLERTAGERELKYLAALNQSIFRMLRSVNRLELAHRLTDENEIRTFPELMDLGSWAESLFRRMESVLALAGVTLDWVAPASLLLNADRHLLNYVVPEMVNTVLREGDHVKLSVTQQGDKVHVTAAVDGEVPKRPQMPHELSAYADDQNIDMIRLIAQLHGGALITCLNGERYRSLTIILPQRLDLPAGRLESPHSEPISGGFDPVLVAFSHLLAQDAFLPESKKP